MASWAPGQPFVPQAAPEQYATEQTSPGYVVWMLVGPDGVPQGQMAMSAAGANGGAAYPQVATAQSVWPGQSPRKQPLDAKDSKEQQGSELDGTQGPSQSQLQASAAPFQPGGMSATANAFQPANDQWGEQWFGGGMSPQQWGGGQQQFKQGAPGGKGNWRSPGTAGRGLAGGRPQSDAGSLFGALSLEVSYGATQMTRQPWSKKRKEGEDNESWAALGQSRDVQQTKETTDSRKHAGGERDSAPKATPAAAHRKAAGAGRGKVAEEPKPAPFSSSDFPDLGGKLGGAAPAAAEEEDKPDPDAANRETAASKVRAWGPKATPKKAGEAPAVAKPEVKPITDDVIVVKSAPAADRPAASQPPKATGPKYRPPAAREQEVLPAKAAAEEEAKVVIGDDFPDLLGNKAKGIAAGRDQWKVKASPVLAPAADPVFDDEKKDAEKPAWGPAKRTWGAPAASEKSAATKNSQARAADRPVPPPLQGEEAAQSAPECTPVAFAVDARVEVFSVSEKRWLAATVSHVTHETKVVSGCNVPAGSMCVKYDATGKAKWITPDMVAGTLREPRLSAEDEQSKENASEGEDRRKAPQSDVAKAEAAKQDEADAQDEADEQPSKEWEGRERTMTFTVPEESKDGKDGKDEKECAEQETEDDAKEEEDEEVDEEVDETEEDWEKPEDEKSHDTKEGEEGSEDADQKAAAADAEEVGKRETDQATKGLSKEVDVESHEEKASPEVKEAATSVLGDFFSKKGKGKKLKEKIVELPKADDCDALREKLFAARGDFLQYRLLAEEVPEEVSNLVAREHETAFRDSGKGGDDAKLDRSMFGTDMQRGDKRSKNRQNEGRDKDIVREKPAPLKQAENAWKARTPTSKGGGGEMMLPRLHEMQRTVNGLLNKVCPENVATIIDAVAKTDVQTVDELELVISLIFKKALAEPHYCETYADMVFELKQRMPEFPAQDESGKKVTFKTVLLNACQNEFEALPKILKLTGEEVEGADLEEIEFIKKKKKDRVLANMKFIGQLFLRQLLSAKIIGSVIQDLTNCEQAEVLPEEPMIECICELLTNIGYTLEATPVGKAALTSVSGRLLDLKTRLTSNGKGLYSKRIQFSIQDVLDMRKAGWTRKTHKATAKTKDEIKKEQEREHQAAARGKEVPSGEVLVAGARPAYLASPSGRR